MAWFLMILLFTVSVTTVSAQPQAAAEPALAKALGEHLSYDSGFRQKLRTGTYRQTQQASPEEGARLFPQLIERLGELSDQQPTFMLVHAIDANGHLRAWLLGKDGLVASGQTSAAFKGLGSLLDNLGVNARTSTRAPRRRNAPPPVPVEDVSTPETRRQALEFAAGTLLPQGIASALAERNGRLLVLPVRDTGTAPFAALPLAGAVLNDRFSVVVLPDVTLALGNERTLHVRRLRFNTTVLVADPDLSRDAEFEWGPIPETRTETLAVAEQFGIDKARILSGDKASRDAVIGAIAGYGKADIVYLASHGLANSTNPMDGSFIALTGGHLYGRDLRGSRFDAWAGHHPLVVLSACQTGLGKTFDGGTFGVARAWFAAGAAQVVASLWNVDDQATAYLMEQFAEKLYFGATPEEAMQMAQRRAAAEYPDDPGAWASFSVYGAPATR
ncbi:CHAT domain-containing protein [Blastomonas sp.]|uniref:CHAT domain-containing protein n=1 Tax=Blastomonas sp. TaxID=1909299 RepID=UPI003593242D